jgi:hypothetical protein
MPTPAKKRGRRKTKPEAPRQWTWGQAKQDAFDQLKAALSSPPVLTYADFTRPFELHTDASAQGLGAILYQEDADGLKRVVAYVSRALSKAEKNYPAHKLEFLALKWSVTEKFRDYLCGANFTVHTDNNPLTYVLTTAKLDATGHRWLAALSIFNFKLRYKPGTANIDADILSRLPSKTDEHEEIAEDVFHTICSPLIYNYVPVVATHCLSATPLDEADALENEQLRPHDARKEQNSDPVIGSWMR